MAPTISRRIAGLGLPAALAAGGLGTALGAPPPLDQNLAPLARFLGRWQGAASGQPGAGVVERSYKPVLSGRFIEERNESRYRSGEIHRHLAYWSYDRGRRRFVLRQLHAESFVNQFVATTADFADSRLIVVSESIENIPPGYSARETYHFSSSDAFEEVFDIAAPDRDYETYSHTRFWRRS